jgi:hypothetical protein
MRKVFRGLTITMLVIACAGPKVAAPVPPRDPAWLSELAEEKVGSSPTIERNKNESFALCWKDAPNSSSIPVLQFIIVRMVDHRVMEQGSATMADINWTGDYEIQVTSKQGQAELQRSAGSVTRTIDVRKYL